MKYKIVEVTWVDAEEHGDVGWNDLKAMKRYAKKPCPVMKSVGYVLHQSKKHIALISTIGSEECSTVEKIPIEFVNNIKVLKDVPSRASNTKDEKE